MPDLSITLPFKVPDLFAGFAEGKGLAKVSPSELGEIERGLFSAGRVRR